MKYPKKDPKKSAVCLGLLAMAIAIPLSDVRAQVEAYPAKGQSPMQQEKDKAACERWAKTQTGFDPQQALQNAPPAPPPPEAVLPRRRAKEEQQELAQESAQQQQMKKKLDAYDKAEALCLKGRGYEVG